MRIQTPNPDGAFSSRCRQELDDFLSQPDIPKIRPCPGCNIPCACSRSTSCGCGCSADCTHAARQMSVDPEKFPIESRVAPLVFAFYRFGLCMPCWSCEGHLDASGALHRPPQVWFYSRSLLYPRLIGQHLNDLQTKRAIGHAWRVRICGGDGADTVFSLEPDLTFIATPDLPAMQRDIPIIASDLVERVHALARRQRADLGSAPTGAVFDGHPRF